MLEIPRPRVQQKAAGGGCEQRRWESSAIRRRTAPDETAAGTLGVELLRHDLGQPLATLLAGSEILEGARGQMSAETSDALDALQAATLRLAVLVQSLRATGAGAH